MLLLVLIIAIIIIFFAMKSIGWLLLLWGGWALILLRSWSSEDWPSLFLSGRASLSLQFLLIPLENIAFSSLWTWRLILFKGWVLLLFECSGLLLLGAWPFPLLFWIIFCWTSIFKLGLSSSLFGLWLFYSSVLLLSWP